MLRAALPRRTLLASAAFVGAVAHHEDKLPIYPAPEQQLILIDDPSELEKQIGVVRTRVTQTYDDVYSQAQSVVSKWIGVEHAVETRVKSLIAPDEPLTPGILYVAVAALTGSVVARNRSILTRLILPPTLFIASAHHFLPKTSGNVADYLGALEDKYAPTFAEKHDIGKAHSAMAWERAKEATVDSRARAEAALTKFLGKVQEATGLKLRDATAWGHGVGAEAKARSVGVIEAVKEKGHDAEGEVKVKAREVVDRLKEQAAIAEKEGQNVADAVERKVENKRLV